MKPLKDTDLFNKTFYIIFISFVIIVFSVCYFLPKWIIAPSSGRIIFDENTGEIGDSMGGILGPPIAIIVAGLTFLAFWMQFQANKILKLEIEKNEKSKIEEAFEHKFYELLRLHRTNIEDLSLGKTYKNRRVFQLLFIEFKFIFESILNLIYSQEKKMNESYCGFNPNDYDRISNIAYVFYYWGVGPISTKMAIPQLKELCTDAFANDCIGYFTKVKEIYKKQKHISESSNSITKPVDYSVVFKYKGIKKEEKYKFRYTPIDGHGQRLGHYYRHLFQIVKFVSDFDPETINDQKKYDFIKTLRAQLSSYEQLLLYYNSLSGLGKAWNDPKNDFIAKFRLIKNIPIPLTEFANDPYIKYKTSIEKFHKEGVQFFEWDEK